MNTYLFSQGGSGTEYTYHNFAFVGYKGGIWSHQKKVTFPNETDKFVYILNNPIDILLSFQRRNFLNDSFCGTIQLFNSDLFDFATKNKLKYGLKEISEQGKDFFQFENHFNCFMKQKNKGLFIKFNALDKGWEAIEKFTGMKPKSIFEWKPKLSSIEQIDVDCRINLMLIYKEWIKKYDSLPNVFFNN